MHTVVMETDKHYHRKNSPLRYLATAVIKYKVDLCVYGTRLHSSVLNCFAQASLTFLSRCPE